MAELPRCDSFDVEMSERGSVTPPSPALSKPPSGMVSPMEGSLPPSHDTRKRRSATLRSVGGIASPVGDRARRQYYAKEEFDLALHSNQLKGVGTAAANAILNHTTTDVHRRAGSLISHRTLHAVCCVMVQPYFLLALFCIAALVATAIEDENGYLTDPAPHTPSYTFWLLLEAAVVSAVLLLHTMLDVSLYTRRTTDMFNKFTSLLNTRRCVISGGTEGLTGLRDADSCRMLSVLRNAGTPSSDVLRVAEHTCEGWESHELVRNAVRTSCSLQQLPSTVGLSSTDVVFKIEVWCSSASFLPLSFTCTFCTRYTNNVTLHAQVAAPDGGWCTATWQKLELGAEIDCSGTGTVTPELIITASPFQFESTETIKVRNVSVSHRAWRWRSVPEAMTVASNDIAMDIGKMQIYRVSEQTLMGCLTGLFSTDPSNELPDPSEPPKVPLVSLSTLVKSPTDHGSPGSCTPTSFKDEQVSPFLSPADPSRAAHIRVESEVELASLHSGSIDGRADEGECTSEEEDDTITTADLQELRTGTSRPTPSQSMMFLVQRCMAYLSFVLLIAVAVANVLWVVLYDVGHLSWFYRFVQGPVLIVLSLLPLGATFVLRIIDCYANACLRSMMEMQDKTLHTVVCENDTAVVAENERGTCASSYTTTTSFDSLATESSGAVVAGDIFARDEGQLMLGEYNSNLSGLQPPPSREESGMNIDTLSHPSINRKMIAKHMWAMITNTASQAVPKRWWGATYDLLYSRNACQVLGSMTVLTCLDKSGILSEVVPVPEKVLVMKRRDEGWDDERVPEEYHEVAFNILELHNDETSENLIQFADPEWRRHLAQLKPLGLTAALHCMQHLELEVSDVAPQQRQTRSSRHGRRRRHKPSHIREQLHFDDTILWGKYLYFLGKEIGFSVELLHALGFKVMKRIHTLRPIETFKKRRDKHVDPKESATYDAKTANYDPTLDGRQQMASLVVIDSSGNWQLLSIGHPQFILEYTSDYWNGEEVLPLKTTDKRELLYTSNEWRRQRDLVTVAFSYRPLSPHYKEYVMNDKSGVAIHILETETEKHTNEDFEASSDEDSADEALEGMSAEIIYQRLQKKQIFIGMVGSRAPPKNMVQDLIAEFRDAGIRFMHFNTGNERMTKAFGEKLGLWTTANDWNCCISLKRDAKVHKSAVKARLPAGIKRIREHIATTDNVPLLVPLFCDSHPVAVRQMISILQENNEVVGCMGSCLNHTNMPSFLQADFGISTMPTSNSRFLHQNHAFTGSNTMFGLPGCPIGNVNNKERYDAYTSTLKGLFNLGSLISLPCAITLTPSEYPLYFILCLVKQARLQLHCMLKMAEVLISCSVCWGLCCFCTTVALMPPVLRVTDLCWQLYLLLPLQSLALYEPFESLMCKKVMKIHPNKNAKAAQWNVFKHLVKLWAARYLPTCIALLAVYSAVLMHSSKQAMVDLLPPGVELMESNEFLNAVQYAQQVTMCVAVMFFTMHSIGSLSRHLQVKVLEIAENELGRKQLRIALFRRKLGAVYYNPFEFSSFYVTNLVAWILQAGYSYASLTFWAPGGSASYDMQPPFYLYPSVLTYMLVILVVDDRLKLSRKKRYSTKQTWRKFDFDTRLGMHSPRGDDSGDEDKGALKEAKEDSKTYWDTARFFSI